MLVRTCERCGKEFEAYPSAVRAGKARHCSAACVDRRRCATRHGASRTRLYGIWAGMKGRCQNPNHPAFAHYGGRGVRVCAEWEAFEPFRDWAMANGYAAGLEIDRIDPAGPYGPGNCRWATPAQQSSNTRKRRDAKTSRFKGVSLCRATGRWRAQVHGAAGRSPHVGVFDTQEEAARAYDRAAREAFGEFAVLNFPEG